jgi:hypothetical protein
MREEYLGGEQNLSPRLLAPLAPILIITINYIK